MKAILQLLVLFVLSSIQVCAQTTVASNGILLKVNSNCSNVFYEGQSIHFSYTLENTSNAPVFLSGNIYPQIKSVIDLSNNQEIKYKNSMVYYEEPRNVGKHEEIKATLPHDYMESFSIYLGYNNYGNASVSDYIALNASQKALKLPLFFKPGKYKMVFGTTLQPGNIDLSTNIVFEVKAAVGQTKSLLLNYLKAIVEDARSFDENDVKLWGIANSGVENPYAIEAFRLITIESDFISIGIMKLRGSVPKLYQLYLLLPQFKKCEAGYTAYWFLRQNVGKIDLFRKAGLISDIQSFSDEYLKKIAHFNKGVSQTFIKSLNKTYNIQNLTNYSTQE